MSNVTASIGNVQLKKLDGVFKQEKRNIQFLYRKT